MTSSSISGRDRSNRNPRRKGWIYAIVALAVLALGAGGYYFMRTRTVPAPADVRSATDQAVAPAAPVRPLPEAGETIDLPPIDQTDAIVRELVDQALVPPDDCRLAHDRSPHSQLHGRRRQHRERKDAHPVIWARSGPAGSFQVREERGSLWIDARSFRRYDKYADAVAALDARGAARLYATLRPRLVDGYRELGHPDGNFDQAFERAIIELLKTPVIEGDIALASKSVAYEFADPRLQSLSSAQRQFLRMGSRNVRLIQAKLREMAPFLGIPPESLPR